MTHRKAHKQKQVDGAYITYHIPKDMLFVKCDDRGATHQQASKADGSSLTQLRTLLMNVWNQSLVKKVDLQTLNRLRSRHNYNALLEKTDCSRKTELPLLQDIQTLTAKTTSKNGQDKLEDLENFNGSVQIHQNSNK